MPLKKRLVKPPTDNFGSYIATVERALKSGDSTEHTHRPALKTFIESTVRDSIATNEPKRIAVGAPDFNIKIRMIPVGYIETKDIGTPLEDLARGRGASGPQFKRYLNGLPNWLLSDYLTFRWYVDGALRDTITIGTRKGSKILLAPDAEANLTNLLTRFANHKSPMVSTTRELAEHLAGLAQIVDSVVEKTFKNEKPDGYLHRWFVALQRTLIPDLKSDTFADMFAQTLAYGLFAARISTPPGAPFTRATAPFSLPKSNPFLRKFFSEVSGVDMPDTLEWVVDDIISLLDRTDIPAITADLVRTTGHDDPVVHFYETFLALYKPRQRSLRGVYYTPRPVVNYIVASVDEILRTDFGAQNGLADNDVLLLDPALGTGTFLYVAIELIRKQFTKGAWPKYVRAHLLQRIFGFELLMAPYAIAHIKISLQLGAEFTFSGTERLGIFLTNTLEGSVPHSSKGLQKFISDEAREAEAVKNDEPILVVMGNPPYRGVSQNKSAWIQELIADYRFVDGKPLGEKKVWLQNDYVKFIRFAQWRVDKTGYGVVAFITDNSYLDSPTFRGMRQSLMSSFDEITIYNLHGSTMRRETSPDGSRDVNVFDIQQGVSIVFLVKKRPTIGTTSKSCKIEYQDLYGLREEKYKTLDSTTRATTQFVPLNSVSPGYDFVPIDTMALAAYEQGFLVNEIFETGSNGVQTSRDHLVVDFNDTLLAGKLRTFGDASIKTADIRRTMFEGRSVGDYPDGDMSEFNVPTARQAFQNDRQWRAKLRDYLYRPFDVRRIIFADYLIHRPRHDVMRHFDIPDNIALCVGRAGLVKASEWTWSFVSTDIVDHNIFYRGSSQNYPLYIEDMGDLLSAAHVRANLSDAFTKALSKRTGLRYTADTANGDLAATFGARDAFCYIYGVLNSPAYRQRYRAYLDKGYPRIPLPTKKAMFAATVRFGDRLVGMHTLKAKSLTGKLVTYDVAGTDEVEYVAHDAASDRVYINDAQYFEGITEAEWDLEFGGYPVLNKWLADRTGYQLTYDEIETYSRIAEAVKETIKIGIQLDALWKPALRPKKPRP